MTHPGPGVLTRYATGGSGLDDATVWTIEAHLETCADCREHLIGGTTDDTRALLDLVAAGIDREIAAGPAPVRPRSIVKVRTRWLIGTLLPWLTMTALVIFCAGLLNAARYGVPFLVLLVAPLAPLPGVAVAWSRRSDHAWEMIASTPATGIVMMLRRTLAVLLFVIPLLAVVGYVTGTSLALVLLPSLAFTAGTIALGALIGVQRAAILLGVVWVLGVALPSVITYQLPPVLQPGSAAVWALATAALAGLAAIRADNFRRQISWR